MAEDRSEFWVSERGSRAWVGLVLRLLLVSTETGPEMSLQSILSLDGGRFLWFKHLSTLINPLVSGFDFFCIQRLRSPLM